MRNSSFLSLFSVNKQVSRTHTQSALVFAALPFLRNSRPNSRKRCLQRNPLHFSLAPLSRPLNGFQITESRQLKLKPHPHLPIMRNDSINPSTPLISGKAVSSSHKNALQCNPNRAYVPREAFRSVSAAYEAPVSCRVVDESDCGRRSDLGLSEIRGLKEAVHAR
jgi:hypothetical protein